MNSMKGLFLVGLGLASAFLGALIMFRALNATATVSHPIRPMAAMFGLTAIMLIATGCYGFAVRGFTNRLAQLTMLFGVIGAIGVSLRWFLPARILVAGVALTALWLLLRRREGRCNLMALAVVLLFVAIGTPLLNVPYAAARRYFGNEQWICVALGCGLIAALAGLAGAAYTAGSRLLPIDLNSTSRIGPAAGKGPKATAL
ncbi:MAG: hypothetical protein C0504_12365 [Candidatus Solibacter sp.]|nr:hypothetical protein [Candidatus Solibacter sp.]